jgi:hypothetical protein
LRMRAAEDLAERTTDAGNQSVLSDEHLALYRLRLGPRYAIDATY